MKLKFVPLVILVLAILMLFGSSAAQANHSSNHIVRDGWDFYYFISQTDGLVIRQVKYNNTEVAFKMSLPQVWVDYGAFFFYDQLGNGPTDGGTAIKFRGIRKINARNGFEIQASYWMDGWPNSCTYKYVHRYVFYADGRFKPLTEAYGPGCDNSATYNVHLRLDLDVGDPSDDGFQKHLITSWTEPETEDPYPDDGTNDPNGFEWRTKDVEQALWIKPGTQDNADFYALRANVGEAAGELSAITLPAMLDNNEDIQNTNNLSWYIGRHNYTRPVGCPPTCEKPITVGPGLASKGY